MAHEIERLADGRDAFASARVPAWHRLGTVLDKKMTAEEALTLTGMANWNVRTEPLVAVVPGKHCPECGNELGVVHKDDCKTGDESAEYQVDNARFVLKDDTSYPVEIPGGFGVIRDNPITSLVDGLGSVGPDYTPIQNEEMAEFLQLVAGESGAVFETAGSLQGGRSVFLTMMMPEGLTIGGRDEHGLYIAANNYHGNGCFRLDVTPIREVCANTQRMVIDGARSTYKIYHRSGATKRVQEAREALGLVWSYRDAFQIEADKLIKTRFSIKKFESLITQVWPEKFEETERAEWRDTTTAQWDQLVDLYKNQDTQENIRGTAWAGYQAVVEYLDWEVPIIGQEGAEAETTRATRNFTGSYDSHKRKAFELVQAIG